MHHKRILFKNLHLVNLDSGLVQRVNVLTEGRKIVDIGFLPDEAGDSIIKCNGMYAVPSLIDMHVHVTFNSMFDGEMSLNNVGLNLAQAAHNGVCIVRDVGMKPSWSIEDINNSMPHYALPKIIFSGSPICTVGGHGWDYGTYIEEDFFDNYISLHKKRGFEWLKIMNDPENHSLSYLLKLVKCAHHEGIKVACHVFREKGIQLACEAGCDTIEHVVPIHCDSISEMSPYYVPTAYSAWVSCSENYLNSIASQEAEYLIEWYDLLKDNMRKAISCGGKILCGTDAGCCPSSFGDIVMEMLILNALGMSEKDVIKAATIESAKCLNCQNLFGSIEVGKYANFFIVRDNPLKNLKTLLKREIVVLFGNVIKDEVNVPW